MWIAKIIDISKILQRLSVIIESYFDAATSVNIYSYQLSYKTPTEFVLRISKYRYFRFYLKIILEFLFTLRENYRYLVSRVALSSW